MLKEKLWLQIIFNIERSLLEQARILYKENSSGHQYKICSTLTTTLYTFIAHLPPVPKLVMLENCLQQF